MINAGAGSDYKVGRIPMELENLAKTVEELKESAALLVQRIEPIFILRPTRGRPG